jgi:hypothetical protein
MPSRSCGNLDMSASWRPDDFSDNRLTGCRQWTKDCAYGFVEVHPRGWRRSRCLRPRRSGEEIGALHLATNALAAALNRRHSASAARLPWPLFRHHPIGLALHRRRAPDFRLRPVRRDAAGEGRQPPRPPACCRPWKHLAHLTGFRPCKGCLQSEGRYQVEPWERPDDRRAHPKKSRFNWLAICCAFCGAFAPARRAPCRPAPACDRKRSDSSAWLYDRRLHLIQRLQVGRLLLQHLNDVEPVFGGNHVADSFGFSVKTHLQSS